MITGYRVIRDDGWSRDFLFEGHAKREVKRLQKMNNLLPTETTFRIDKVQIDQIRNQIVEGAVNPTRHNLKDYSRRMVFDLQCKAGVVSGRIRFLNKNYTSAANRWRSVDVQYSGADRRWHVT